MRAGPGFWLNGRRTLPLFFLSLLIIAGLGQDLLHPNQVFAIRGTPQAIVPNLVDTRRQHMLEKTPNELLGVDGHGRRLSCASGPIPKGHLTVVDRKDSAVGNGDPVDVASQVVEDLTATLDSRFTVNDPVLFPESFRQSYRFELLA
jgi:hypothetical protein